MFKNQYPSHFDAADKLSREKLIEIAPGYMGKNWFIDQPHLLYRHHDAGHQHLHIVTTPELQDLR